MTKTLLYSSSLLVRHTQGVASYVYGLCNLYRNNIQFDTKGVPPKLDNGSIISILILVDQSHFILEVV